MGAIRRMLTHTNYRKNNIKKGISLNSRVQVSKATKQTNENYQLSGRKKARNQDNIVDL